MAAGVGGSPRRRRGALEQQVLDCLAEAGRPMSPAAVQEALGSGLAYTTVMTTLARLCAKGALSREPVGRTFHYSLSGAPDAVAANVAAHQMHRLLAGSDRALVLSRFVSELEPGDEALLMELLQRTDDPPQAASD